MNRDNIDRKELLEKYLLGLTDQEQAEYVEKQLQEDPTMVEDLAELRSKMSTYLNEQGFTEQPARSMRSLRDFQDLDHEMITAMTRRNHHLSIWRMALSAVCLLLLFTTGYLFRENQNFRLEVAREQALHAQDEASNRKKLEALRGKAIVWDSLHTQTIASANGDVLVHFLADDQVTFLDLSHLDSLQQDEYYFLQLNGKDSNHGIDPITDSSRHSLIPILEDVSTISVYRGTPEAGVPPHPEKLVSVVDFPLSRGAQK
ncbi:hypothetical protein [Lewinella sp. 4G2]|uniref:hypothetical protein n=1 Tax=Lewinella sp. 4G2 TaxID=1803372 RepID=UPI0007B475CD|nr:hypothetical protein [Lewinella sp. 4G2]OAV43385.1 hypothetical protein A3850_002230 [Lewinella sp. 4G2]